MVNYQPLLKLLFLVCTLVVGLAQEKQQGKQLEPVHRSKRTLTTICVEIKPNGPQEEPYFMCKGTDFAQGGRPGQQQLHLQQQTLNNYQQSTFPVAPVNVHTVPAPFPSIPSYGAGFYSSGPNYETQPPKAAPAASYQNQQQFGELHGAAHYLEPAGAASFTPAPAPQSDGLPAVSYQSAGGPATASYGAAAGPSATSSPTAYADAAAKKSSPAGQAATFPKSQPSSGQASYGNAYEVLGSNRHPSGMDKHLNLNLPDAGFQPYDLNTQYKRPGAELESIIWAPLAHQPATVNNMNPYHDDPIMRVFYGSLDSSQQVTHMQQAAQMEPLASQVPYVPVAPHTPVYPQPAVSPVAPPSSLPPAPPMVMPAQPVYNANPKPDIAFAQSLPVDSSACNSCNRPCSTPVETSFAYSVSANCPSFQPVIIAMPCYGQQQPTHYLALPNTGATSPSALGGPFGLSASTGFGLGQQASPNLAMPAPQLGAVFGNPQLGSPFGMGPQLGAPFGMAPMLNPFGPLGSLNPFNPFNRILGSATPTTPQPRLRLFGASEGSTATSTADTTFKPVVATQFSSTLPPSTKITNDSTDVILGTAHVSDGYKGDDEEEVSEEDESSEVTDSPHTSGTAETVGASVNPELAKSQETDSTVDELVEKGEEQLKLNSTPIRNQATKRKRQNSRNGNNGSQKRKYIQRL